MLYKYNLKTPKENLYPITKQVREAIQKAVLSPEL